MPDFSKRSYQQELLDRMDVPFNDIKRNMQELEIINTQLGGHQVTLSGFKELFKNENKNNITVCEIGCGGGDNLKAIFNWCHQKNIDIKLIGIDINPDCIRYANENCAAIPCIEFIVSDYSHVKFQGNKPSIIFSSLFSHHLNDSQFANMLHWSLENSAIGFFINDLHRHFLAYYSIKFIASIFSKSYLVKNDAPLSVLRGFKKNEIKNLLKESGINNYTLTWKWAFRWLTIIKH